MCAIFTGYSCVKRSLNITHNIYIHLSICVYGQNHVRWMGRVIINNKRIFDKFNQSITYSLFNMFNNHSTFRVFVLTILLIQQANIEHKIYTQSIFACIYQCTEFVCWINTESDISYRCQLLNVEQKATSIFYLLYFDFSNFTKASDSLVVKLSPSELSKRISQTV